MTTGERARGGEPASSEAAAAAVAPDAASSPGRCRVPAVPRRCRRIHGPQPGSLSARPGLGLRSAQPPGPHGPGTRGRSPTPPVALSPAARPLAVASREPRPPAPQRPAEQAANRGSSAGRGGGGSWASAERAARCACAPPPPPPAAGLNHPPPRTRGGSWRTRRLSGSLLQPCHSQLPQCAFGFALYLGSQWSVQAAIKSVWQDDN